MKKFNLIGYGSLISHNSLKKTIPDRHLTPVIVKGFKRIFNLYGPTYKDGSDFLNIKKSKNSKFNAVMFQLTEKELIKLKEREVEYNIEEAWAYDFTTGKKLSKCLVVIDYIILIDKKGKKPHRPYFTLCREAAYHISKEFGEFWDKTTYTSDGKRIDNWIKKNKRYDTITKKLKTKEYDPYAWKK